MPRSTVAEIKRSLSLTIGGQTMTRLVRVGRVILASPKTTRVPYVRLERYGSDGQIRQYRWNADVEDWSTSVSTDPSAETRWVEEA